MSERNVVLLDGLLTPNQVSFSALAGGRLALTLQCPDKSALACDEVADVDPAGLVVAVLTLVPDEERARLVNHINWLMHPGPKLRVSE